jgi:secreted PhoX family phosphatase
VDPQPILSAGRFSHEAVDWLDGVLYETEDRGDACFYRFLPDRRPREHGDLASNGGTLEALVVRGRPNFDANTANPGESYPVEWVTIEEPNPVDDTVRVEGQSKGAAIFDRTEGIWATRDRLYFDCTTGGEAQLGQLWEYRPRGRDGGALKLIYESTTAEDLEGPDNVVVVPHTGDVFLQEDASDDQFVRGVNRRGEIYDFAHTVLNHTEFCGGCFSPDGRTFFLNQQGDRVDTGPDPALETAALTYAIWGPFDRAGRD